MRDGLAWLLWYGDVTTWEGDGAATDSRADQWAAALPSGSRGKDGNRAERSINAEIKGFIKLLSL